MDIAAMRGAQVDEKSNERRQGMEKVYRKQHKLGFDSRQNEGNIPRLFGNYMKVKLNNYK